MRCDDDTYGTNPAVEGSFPAGTYRIWVGSYRQGENSNYQLYFTELRSVTPSSLGGTGGTGSSGGGAGGGAALQQLDMSGTQANFQSVRVRPGFTPDPARSRGRSGGEVNANQLGGACRGWVARRPDHFVQLQRNFAFLRIFVDSSADTTLVVRTPGGQILCNDDTYGLNPSVEQQSWPQGQYQVWVGSYSEGDHDRYQLNVTELRSVTPDSN